MLSYLLDCYYLSSGCYHLFPLVPTYTFPQVRVNVAFLYYHSFKIKFLCYPQLFPRNSVFLHSTLFVLLLVLSSHPLNPVHLIFNGFNPLIRERLKTRPYCPNPTVLKSMRIQLVFARQKIQIISTCTGSGQLKQ